MRTIEQKTRVKVCGRCGNDEQNRPGREWQPHYGQQKLKWETRV